MDVKNNSENKKFMINYNDNDKIAGLYNVGNTIGKGHYAVVKEAKHVFTGDKVAIKVIDKTKLDYQSREHLFSEVMCMKLVQHPNVVRLYEVIDTASKLYLVLELGDGGDLYDYIMKFENGLPEIKAKRYFRQIVQAIAYCHNLHVVHRDLKPENVVFFEKIELVKLTDFGFSNKFVPGKTLETSCGSLAYSAPEILLGDAYDAPKIDIWSLGVILYMLVCGKLPFEEANDSETLSKIMDCKFDLPTHLSESCKSLIKKMLVREPEKRASLDEILSDKWLEYDNESNYLIDSFSVPLISQEHLTVEEHVEILTKMSEGNLASVEDIQMILDRKEYSYISATYFLLAERKLKRIYLENYCKMKLMELEKEAGQKSTKTDQREDGELLTLSSIGSQKSSGVISPMTESNEERIRRFSMILEDEEDEAEEEELEAMISLASVREELELTVPKFENHYETPGGISAPFPSRCCSRLSDSFDPVPSGLDTPTQLDQDWNVCAGTNNNRFSAFRHQFHTRNRCRSAIYNRRSLIYFSHSLTSIPSFTQLMNEPHHKDHPSSVIGTAVSPALVAAASTRDPHSLIRSPQKINRIKSLLSPMTQVVVPRFQRNFSLATFNRHSTSSSSNERSFDDNFLYFNKHRVSLPNTQHTGQSLHMSRKRCSYPALFPPTNTNLSHSHSSSDVSDNEVSVLRGVNERKKAAVLKSFGKHFFSASYGRYINLKPHTPELMMSNSSIDSDGSFAAGPKIFCQSSNRRMRIKSAQRSRPSSMGPTMSTSPFDDFQQSSSLMGGGGLGCGSGGAGVTQIISEEQNASSPSSPTSIPLSNSPTVASITMHRDICAPIHEEEELIRSRSYIDKETTGLDYPSTNQSLNRSYRSVSVDCRRKSESAEGTPAKWVMVMSGGGAGGGVQNHYFTSTTSGSSSQKRSNVPISVPLQPNHKLNSHSLSSQLTQSNFSLSSFASSLRDSKAMMNLVRGAFELQCLANKIKTTNHQHHHQEQQQSQQQQQQRQQPMSKYHYSATGHHHNNSNNNGQYRSDVCASTSVIAGRESGCDYASVASLPLSSKLQHSPDDSESLILLKNADSTSPDHVVQSAGAMGTTSMMTTTGTANPSNCCRFSPKIFKKKSKMTCSHSSADRIDDESSTVNKKSIFVNNNSATTNPFIRTSSNVSRKARFILSCCRPS